MVEWGEHLLCNLKALSAHPKYSHKREKQWVQRTDSELA